MRLIQQKSQWLFWLTLATAAILLAGCNQGSPPTGIERTVNGTVLVRFADGSTQALANAVVALVSGTTRYQSQPTDATGAFAIPSVLSPRTYQVQVTPPTGSTVTFASIPDVDLPADSTPFAIPAINASPTSVTATVEGQVRLINDDGSNTGQGNVTVILTDMSNPANVFQGVSAANGSFSIANVTTPATYAVTIQPGAGANVATGALGNVALPIANSPGAVTTINTIFVTPTTPGLPPGF